MFAEGLSLEAMRKNLLEQLDEAMEVFLQKLPVARKVPEAVRKELHEILLRDPRERPAVDQVWADLQLKARFGVGRDSWRAYAQRVRSVRTRAARGQAILALAGLEAMPSEEKEDLHDKGDLLLLGRAASVLQDDGLWLGELEQLVVAIERMGNALSRQRTARAQTAAQELGKRRLARETRAARPKRDPERELSLEERARRIYGVELPPIEAVGEMR